MKTNAYIFFLSLLAIGCTSAEPEQAKNGANRNLDPGQVSRGKDLFLQHCAACHGRQGEATPDWRKAGADGKYPAPPLNGTAHTWHHSDDVLFSVIQNGTARIGGNMPAWKDKLSEQDTRSIISWIKSIWPDEIYEAWYRNNGKK